MRLRPRIWIPLVGLFLVAAGAVAVFVASQSEPRLHAQIVDALSRGLDSEVTLESVEVRFFPRLSVIGRGLEIRHLGRHDIPPLVVVRQFACDMSWRRFFDRHLDQVHLDGLEITIPPGRRKDMPELKGGSSSGGPPSRLVIGTLLAHDARLTVLPKNAGKNPRVFDIFDLTMNELGFETGAPFTATITNPIPFGTIETQGTFGPWAASDPRETPLSGTFRFAADLSTIKGIAGGLRSTGRYAGTIERVETSGETTTTDFRIPSLEAAALPLSTKYDALVDGTNGDVELKRVEATLGRSTLGATGTIVGTKGIKGKRVLLRVTSTDAWMEDILSLTVRAQPPAMTGHVELDASLDLPQGDRDIVERIRLEGTVAVKTARFTVDRIQDKVDDLSRRGRGRPADESIANVASDFSTTFKIANGTVSLSQLTYRVSGASVLLAGTYGLASGALDFDGEARLVASASQTQTGVKRVLLMPFNFLFRKGGAGTLVGINIDGTVDSPKVGVDLLRRKK